MHSAILTVVLFHSLAVLELFAFAAFEACRPAARHTPRVAWIAAPLPAAQVKPDASNGDYADSYDEAA
jgi:ABC-type transport system involved in cytochrome c biogenesis permease component